MFSWDWDGLVYYCSLSVSYPEWVGWTLPAINAQFMFPSVFISAGECVRWDTENRCITPDEKILHHVEFLWAAGIIPFKCLFMFTRIA